MHPNNGILPPKGLVDFDTLSCNLKFNIYKIPKSIGELECHSLCEIEANINFAVQLDKGPKAP
jgi:hypothetical protein